MKSCFNFILFSSKNSFKKINISFSKLNIKVKKIIEEKNLAYNGHKK